MNWIGNTCFMVNMFSGNASCPFQQQGSKTKIQYWLKILSVPGHPK